MGIGVDHRLDPVPGRHPPEFIQRIRPRAGNSIRNGFLRRNITVLVRVLLLLQPSADVNLQRHFQPCRRLADPFRRFLAVLVPGIDGRSEKIRMRAEEEMAALQHPGIGVRVDPKPFQKPWGFPLYM